MYPTYILYSIATFTAAIVIISAIRAIMELRDLQFKERYRRYMKAATRYDVTLITVSGQLYRRRMPVVSVKSRLGKKQVSSSRELADQFVSAGLKNGYHFGKKLVPIADISAVAIYKHKAASPLPDLDWWRH